MKPLFMTVLAAVILTGHYPPAHAAGDGAAATHSALGGGHERAEATFLIRGGWPRLGLRGQMGAGRGLAPLLELNATPSWRVESSLGLGFKLAKSRRGRISAEALLGWQLQYGSLPQRGPSAVARVRALVTGKVVGAWIAVGTRHTLLFDRTTVTSAAGTDTNWSARHRWSPHLAGGLTLSLHSHVGLEFGLDMVFVDVGVVEVSLPDVHASLIIGAPRPALQ